LKVEEKKRSPKLATFWALLLRTSSWVPAFGFSVFVVCWGKFSWLESNSGFSNCHTSINQSIRRLIATANVAHGTFPLLFTEFSGESKAID